MLGLASVSALNFDPAAKLAAEEYIIKSFQCRLDVKKSLEELRMLLESRHCMSSKQVGWDSVFCSEQKPIYLSMERNHIKELSSWCKEAAQSMRHNFTILETLDTHHWCHEEITWAKMGILSKTIHRLHAAATGVRSTAGELVTGVVTFKNFTFSLIEDVAQGLNPASSAVGVGLGRIASSIAGLFTSLVNSLIHPAESMHAGRKAIGSRLQAVHDLIQILVARLSLIPTQMRGVLLEAVSAKAYSFVRVNLGVSKLSTLVKTFMASLEVRVETAKQQVANTHASAGMLLSRFIEAFSSFIGRVVEMVMKTSSAIAGSVKDVGSAYIDGWKGIGSAAMAGDLMGVKDAYLDAVKDVTQAHFGVRDHK